MYDLIIKNARLYPMTDSLRQSENTAMGISNGRIAAITPDAEELGSAHRVIDAKQQVVLPGLIDCHTHALYAGNRMHEHSLRLNGASYAEIAASGGGILSTVEAVRNTDESMLIKQTLPRIHALCREGVTCIEVKSGYGLDTETELKMLRAIRELNDLVSITLIPTFLGAHAIPPDKTRGEYLREIKSQMLPAIAEQGLAKTVDIFVESFAFDVDDMCDLFAQAKGLGLSVRAHCEQLSNSNAARPAAEMGAISLDHLEYLNESGIKAMSESGTVAVLLPGAFYFLGETKKPPIQKLRKAGVPIAVATDLNPGSSPIASLLTCLHMSCIDFGLTPEEALLGVTKHAAQALSVTKTMGTLETGKRADFTLWDVPSPEFLTYQLGGVLPTEVLVHGEPISRV